MILYKREGDGTRNRKSSAQAVSHVSAKASSTRTDEHHNINIDSSNITSSSTVYTAVYLGTVQYLLVRYDLRYLVQQHAARESQVYGRSGIQTFQSKSSVYLHTAVYDTAAVSYIRTFVHLLLLVAVRNMQDNMYDIIPQTKCITPKYSSMQVWQQLPAPASEHSSQGSKNRSVSTVLSALRIEDSQRSCIHHLVAAQL